MKLNKEAISNLEQNRSVATSLKNYAADMTALTYHAGVVLAAMNGYGMYERIGDSDCEVADSVKNFFKQICQVLNLTILIPRCRGMEYQTGCGRLEMLRENIIQEAQKADQNSELLDQYASLLEVLNPIYAAFLVKSLAGKPEKDIQPCTKLLSLLEQAVLGEDWKNLEEEAIPYLISMEGLQERYYQPLYRYQLAFQDIYDGFAEEIQKKDLNRNYEALDKTRRLLSSSPFAPLP